MRVPFLRKVVAPRMEYGDWLYIVALCNYAIRTYPGDLSDIPDAFVNVTPEELEGIVRLLTEKLEALA